MDKFVLTEIFTLLPKDLYSPQLGKNALMGQFSLDENVPVGVHFMEKDNAVVVYRQSGQEGEEPLPFVVKMLEEACNIPVYNKVMFHYSKEKRLSHTIIYNGEELKLANSFRADSFESALYFLFLSIQGLQMNPKQCVVRVCCPVTEEQERIFAKFFNGFQVKDLNIYL